MSTDDHDNISHNVEYDKTIDIYQNDDVDNVINQFIIDNNIMYGREQLIKEIKKLILNISAGFKILDSRYITCIGARISHVDNVVQYDIESTTYTNIKTQRYLLNVWHETRNK
jgi:hypothetical protein